ncbi:hypothetical protein BDQ12DRAFT_229523 [Crucibulum laeve]|uniref:Uncharacterized protein n=1 Tax=Crucibulum laeve TaxID=68775 RepID=A0A5C3LWY4_9AGAR|nr:hypothetical protein BDQ12DRAFT_229523 [Crucibulum laeve]
MSSLDRRMVGSWAISPSPIYDSPFVFYQSRQQVPRKQQLPRENLNVTAQDSRLFSSTSSQKPAASSLFPHLLFSSKESSMKLRLSKASVASSPHPEPHLDKFKNVPAAFYDDPAFSADPHSHPYFVTGHDSQSWSTPPALGHPILKNQYRHQSSSAPSTVDESTDVHGSDDELQLLQPPNSPMSPDDLTGPQTGFPFFDSPAPSSSNVTLSSSASPQATTPPSSVPSSSDSHVRRPADMPRVAAQSQHLPQQNEPKKRGFLAWRRSAPVSNTPSALASPAVPQQRPHDEPQPSSYNPVTPPLRPSASRHQSTPVMHPMPELLVTPLRPATAAIDTRPTAPSNKQSSEGRRRRARELDRIDELDESNPLGIPLHHESPYEGIRRLHKDPNMPRSMTGAYYNHHITLQNVNYFKSSLKSFY